MDVAADPKLTKALNELIEKNREPLIRALVPDREAQEQLVQINKAIVALRLKKPDLVGAWGLGCGGSCLAPVGGRLGGPVE